MSDVLLQDTKSIFVSYARQDGGALALHLQSDLRQNGFDVWLDTSEIEGGASWSVAIEQALDRCEIALVVLSHAAHNSEICRAEQIMSLDKGKRVIPVLAQADAPRPVHLYTRQYLDFSDDVHYKAMLDQLIELLKGSDQSEFSIRQTQFRARLVTAPKLPPEYIARTAELDHLQHAVLDDAAGKSTIMTALYGPGGVGKSVLAMALCHNEIVQAAFPDGILWVPIGHKPDSLIDQIKEIGTQLGDSAAKYSTKKEAIASLRALLPKKSVLIVLDDVAEAAQVEAFRMEAQSCRVLITTHNKAIASALGANELTLGAMTSEQGTALLGSWTKRDDPLFAEIAERLTNIPLALTLTGARLREGMLAQEWLDTFQHLAEEKTEPPVGIPNKVLEHCFELSVDQIPVEDRRLYHTLGIFQEDRLIPQEVVIRLWRAFEPTLSEHGCAELIVELARLALVERNAETKMVTLHSLLHDYTHRKLGDHLITTHEALIRSYNPLAVEWYTIPDDDCYIYDTLAYHLDAVGRRGEFVITMRDLRYLAVRTLASKASATERDLTTATAMVPSDLILEILLQEFGAMVHLLNRCTTMAEISSTLYSRLFHVPELTEACRLLEVTIPKPHLVAWHALPDVNLSDPDTKTSNHPGIAYGCAVAPDNSWAVMASGDTTLKVLEVTTGAERYTLKGHTAPVTSCTVSIDGRWIISSSDDQTLKVWDANNGTERLTLTGHTGPVNSCAAFIDRYSVVSTSQDGTIKIWDTLEKADRLTLPGNKEPMNGCAVAPVGDWIVGVSEKNTLKGWDVVTGTELFALAGHTAVINGCAISVDGHRVVSASSDQTLKVWDTVTHLEQKTLSGHTGEVFGCAVSPNLTWVASVSRDQSLKVWDIVTGECLATFQADGILYGCAWHPDSNFILACGERGLYWLHWIQ